VSKHYKPYQPGHGSAGSVPGGGSEAHQPDWRTGSGWQLPGRDRSAVAARLAVSWPQAGGGHSVRRTPL